MRASLAVALALPALLAACAVSPSLDGDERTWLAAFEPLQAQVEAEGLPLRVAVVADPHRHSSPALMRSSPAGCTLVIAVRGNVVADFLMRGFDAGERPKLIRAVLAHEVGHCRDHLSDPAGWAARAARQPPAATPGRPVGTPEGEALADVYALAWTARHYPDDFALTLRFFRHMRSLPGLAEGAHAAGRWSEHAEQVPRLAARADPLAVARHVVLGRALPPKDAAIGAL